MGLRLVNCDIIHGTPQVKKEFRLPPELGKPDRIKLRFRNSDFATVFLKYPDCIRHFYIKDAGDYFTTEMELGRNQRKAA